MMRKNILYKLFLCLLTCVAAVSCSDDGEDSLLVPPRESVTYLTIRTKVIGGTDDASRAEEAKEYEDNELKILRVLILQPDDATTYKVEHNVISSSGKNTFKVKSNEKKLIYLLGNVEDAKMEGTSAETWRTLQRAVKGQRINPKDIDELVLNGYGRQETNKDNPLPMTAKHEVTTVRKEDSKTDKMECTLYIVPVANKFTFTYAMEAMEESNGWGAGRQLKVVRWSIDKVADCSFLIPHVGDNGDLFESDIFKPTEKNPSPAWMHWLKDESDNRAGESTNIPNDYQWLTDYDLPKKAEHETFTAEPYDLVMTKEAPKTADPNVYYMPESKYIPESTDQKYTLTVVTEETLSVQGTTYTSEVTYTATLPQCKSLFRNTHVKVNVVFTAYKEMDLEVDLYPYTGVDLDPDFGIDVPAEGGTETPGEQN